MAGAQEGRSPKLLSAVPWQRVERDAGRNLNKWSKREQNIFRQFVSEAEVMTPDGSGRILIPKRYLQMAGIKSDVRFIGMDNTIEIWAKEVADQPFMNNEEFSNALEETLGTYPGGAFFDEME